MSDQPPPQRTHHALDYLELGVTDLAATRAFYEQAFGWRFTAYGPDYAGFADASGSSEVGGLNARRTPSSGGPLALLYSADLDATADAVRAAGGTVTEGPYDFPGGRRLHFRDPSGNELGVWSSS